MSANETFVAWLRSSRESAGLSQQQVADAMKAMGFTLAQQQIAKVERGERPLRLDEAVAIAGVFAATVDVALGVTAGLDELVARQAATRAALLGRIRVAIDAELGGEAA